MHVMVWEWDSLSLNPSNQKLVALSPGHSQIYLTAMEKNREKAWDQNYAKLRHGPEMVDSVN